MRVISIDYSIDIRNKMGNDNALRYRVPFNDDMIKVVLIRSIKHILYHSGHIPWYIYIL